MNRLLPPPARYSPWMNGRYDVAPGLRPFGTDFGNGHHDQCLLQIDRRWPDYRANKEAALGERAGKYRLRDRLKPETELLAAHLLASRLAAEHPGLFFLREHVLTCALTETQIDLTEVGALDEIAFEIQEDLAIVQRDGDEDYIAALHLCAPSHWAGEDKIGRSFRTVHEDIPGFAKVNAVASRMVQAMVQQGPFVRFVWGVESDERLNHHPVAPRGMDQAEWWGRKFGLHPLFVRTERQVTWGLPEVNAALFTIRVQVRPVAELSEVERERLATAVSSMSVESQAYKGVAGQIEAILGLLSFNRP